MRAIVPRQRLVEANYLIASLLVAIVLTGACGGDEVAVHSSTETTSNAESPAAIPASTPLPGPSEGNPFRGSAQVADAMGDVDGTGDGPPGIDLVGARVVSSERQLVFIWYTAVRAATSVDAAATASWKIELANGDTPAYDVTFQVSGKEWDILILDRETNEETKHRIGSIYNDRLDVPYPANKLDKLQPTFSWTASSHFVDASGASWTDRTPDDGSMLAYPSS